MTTTYVDEYTVARGLLSGWTATPIVWENTGSKPAGLAAWMRFTLLSTATDHIGMPMIGRRARHSGEVVLEFFVPIGGGPGDVLRLVDQAMALFAGKTTGGLRFLVPVPDIIGEDEGWYRVNLRCPFIRDFTF